MLWRDTYRLNCNGARTILNDISTIDNTSGGRNVFKSAELLEVLFRLYSTWNINSIHIIFKAVISVFYF